MICSNVEWLKCVKWSSYAGDAVDCVENGLDWGEVGGLFSNKKVESCKEWTARFSLGFSLPGVSSAIYDVYEEASKGASMFSKKMFDAVNGLSHLVKDLGALSYISLGRSASLLDFACESMDFVSGINEMTHEIAESTIRNSYEGGLLLCIKTAQIVCVLTLGIFALATFAGGAALVSSVITPVGLLALGTAALVLKATGNIYEERCCDPCGC